MDMATQQNVLDCILNNKECFCHYEKVVDCYNDHWRVSPYFIRTVRNNLSDITILSKYWNGRGSSLVWVIVWAYIIDTCSWPFGFFCFNLYS